MSQSSSREVERAYQVSEAYAIVSSKLGRARLTLRNLHEQRRQSRGVHLVTQPADAKIEHWAQEVSDLEEIHGFLRSALIGTKFERITPEQVAALNRGEGLAALEAQGNV